MPKSYDPYFGVTDVKLYVSQVAGVCILYDAEYVYTFPSTSPVMLDSQGGKTCGDDGNDYFFPKKSAGWLSNSPENRAGAVSHETIVIRGNNRGGGNRL